MPRVTVAVTVTLVSSRSIRASARAWSTVSSGSLVAYRSPRSRTAAQAAADLPAGRRAHQSVLPSGPGDTCTSRSLRFLCWAAATWSAAMRVATLRVDGGDPGGVHPDDPVDHDVFDGGAGGVVQAVAGGDDLAGVDGGQLPGHDLPEELGEAPGQGGGEADLAPGGPLPDPGGQGHLGGGHRVDEPDLVVDLDRAAVGQAQLVGAGVRDRDQLRPLDRVRHALQVAGDLEQLLGAHRRAVRGQLGTDRGRLGADRGDPVTELVAGHTPIIPEQVYESQSYPQRIALQDSSFRESPVSGQAVLKGGRRWG